MGSLLSRVLQALMIKKGEKKTFGDRETFEKLMETLKAEHQKPFEMNYDKFTVNCERNDIAGMPCFILSPKEKAAGSCALFFHGGAYAMEITPQHWQLLDKLVRLSGVTMWVPVYPLVPGSSVDDALPGVLEVYKAFCEASADDKRFIMGDSAGGGLAMTLAQQAAKNNLPMPSELILISPWLDLSMTNPLIEKINPADATLDPYGLRICGEMWAGDRDIKDPIPSPLFGDLNLDCKINIFTGTRDILNGDAKAFRSRMKKLGRTIAYHEEPGLPHDYVLWPVSEAKKAVKEICRLLQA